MSDINLSRAEIEDAKFWGQAICLECATVQCHMVEGDEPCGPCDACGSEAVFPAEHILRCADFVDPLSDVG